MSLLTTTNWQNIDYLQSGSPRQRAAYDWLVRHNILARLAGFDPVLAGTFPLDITLPGSDLDIICEVHEPERFLRLIHEQFGQYDQYTSYRTTIGGIDSVVARFIADGFEAELFGQPMPVQQQNGYRHMLVEARLLDLGGADFRKNVMLAKQRGLKTEPAFAQLLNLPGDPYQSLLELEPMTDAAILHLLQHQANL